MILILHIGRLKAMQAPMTAWLLARLEPGHSRQGQPVVAAPPVGTIIGPGAPLLPPAAGSCCTGPPAQRRGLRAQAGIKEQSLRQLHHFARLGSKCAGHRGC